MAKKEIDFIIKVNNKELDLSKTSMQKFDVEIKKAKTDLKTLETQFGKNSIQYKGAVKDINAAEKAWKTAQKAAGNMNDQIEKNTAQTKTYSQQIRIEQKALIDIGKQYGKSSQQYADQAAKVKALREEQEDLQRSTLKLDDALGNLPGILGTVGQSMQQFDSITGSAKGALNTLGLGFKTLDQTIKTTLIGFIVGLLATLVAALMDAAKSFAPLKMAMAAIGDAVGALFDALKPVTDFILNVFVGAIKIVASAISGFASLLGGANAGLKQYSVQLEANLKNNEKILSDYANFLGEYTKKTLELEKQFNEQRKAIADDDTLTQEQKVRKLKQIDKLYNYNLKLILDERQKMLTKAKLDIATVLAQTNLLYDDNQRTNGKNALKIQELNNIALLKLDKAQALNRFDLTVKQFEDLSKANKDGKNKLTEQEKQDNIKTMEALTQSLVEQKDEITQYNNLIVLEEVKYNGEIRKLRRENNREDIALIRERLLASKEATIELIKNEYQRNYETAKLAKERLLETQRIEREQNALAGTSAKNLEAKQLAERKAADEQIRKAKLQEDTYLIQLEIDKNNRLSIEAGVGTQEYFDARRKVIEDEYQKEFFLADENQSMEEDAATKHYQSLKELKQEQLQSDLALISKQYDATYENTQMFFDRQRDLLDKQYEIDQETYKNNEQMLLAIKEDYIKKREMVDSAALQWSSDYFTRRAETEKKAYGEMYKDLRFAEDMAFEARKKAAQGNAVELELIEREHQRNMKKILEDEIKDYGYVASQVLDSLSNLTNAIASTYDEEAKTSEAAFNKRKDLQLATAYMSAASGVIQILTQPSTLPSPFDWIVKGINAAALGIATYAQIDNIKNTKFGGTSSSATGGTQYADASFRGYADGGMIEGPRHAQGGTLIEAEGGEAIMSRGSVAAFGPLLSMLNQAGGGTSFNMGQHKSYDNPVSVNGKTQGEPMIIKTYVVSNELTTAQEKQSRLKELSVL